MTRRTFRFDRPRGPLLLLAGAMMLAFAATATQASAATAQPARPGCYAYEKLARLLDSRFAEKPVATGLDSGGKLVEIFASGDGANWTMVATAPDGIACVIAVGEAWSPATPTATGPAV